MKKLLVLFIVCCLLLVPFAQSESLNLQSLTIEELIELKQQINAEIMSRLSSDVLHSGVYTVGKDIAPGSYLVTAESVNVEKYDTVLVALCENVAAFKEMDVLTYENVKVAETIHVFLEEGMVLKINRGTCLISPDSVK